MTSLQDLSSEVVKLQTLLDLTIQKQEILESAVNESKVWQDSTVENMDHFFLIITGIINFLLQGGFALLEAGSVRSKNTTNILIKNLLDSFISGLFYWLFGFAIGYGKGNSFIGYHGFALYGIDQHEYASWFFQYVFAATAATIVSGSVAERCDFVAYLVYSSCITGFIYPVMTHWSWSNEGWLAVGFTDGDLHIKYHDFAGSGIVHCAGGMCAFVAAAVMGPRIGRFDKETGNPVDIKGHSVPLAAIGGFILLFGFLSFNGSSQGSISDPGDGISVAIAVKSTVVGGTGGAFCTMILNRLKWFGDSKWSFLTTLNGCLAGMVATCSSCNDITTYGAFIIGIVGGIMYMVVTWSVIKVKVDDPLDATAVHLGGGMWGVLAYALFSMENGILYRWDKKAALGLVWQLTGLVAVMVWTSCLSFIMFYTLKKINHLRVSFEYEIKGLDIPKHGEPSYPSEAYVHGWGEVGDALGSMIRYLRNDRTNHVIKPTGSPMIDRLRKTNTESTSLHSGVSGSFDHLPKKKSDTESSSPQSHTGVNGSFDHLPHRQSSSAKENVTFF